MALTSSIRAARRRAERNMVDTASVAAKTGSDEDEDGVVTPVYGPALYTGRCAIASDNNYETKTDAGGHNYTVQRYKAEFPVGAFTPAIGLHVYDVRSVMNPALTGRVFRVVALRNISRPGKLIVTVEEVVS